MGNLDLASERYASWCKSEVYRPELVRAVSMLERALDLHLLRLYRELGLEELLKTPRTAAELAADLGFVESAQVALEAALHRLALPDGTVDLLEGDPPRFVAAREPIGDPVSDMEEVRAELEGLGPEFTIPLEFLEFGAENFAWALREGSAETGPSGSPKEETDTRTGGEIIDRILSGLSPEWYPLWDRATNADPVQAVHGKMGARALDLIGARGTFLEIGGGTGNGLRNVLELFEEEDKLDRIERYLFTDISPQFLLRTRKEIRTRFPEVDLDWRHLDLNRRLEDQKIAPESLDVVFGVNAAHIARDLPAFLTSCQRVLRRGGAVVFAERVRRTARDMAPRELALNLSFYHRTAAIRNPEYRPSHAYLTMDNWRRVLDGAGFEAVAVWPDENVYGEGIAHPYAAVVVGVRP